MRTPGLGLKRLSSTSGVFPIDWTRSPYLPPHGRLSRRGSSTSGSVGRRPPGSAPRLGERAPEAQLEDVRPDLLPPLRTVRREAVATVEGIRARVVRERPHRRLREA